jgi:hypothetical protein
VAIIHTDKWEKSKGLGDTIEKIAIRTGIKSVVDAVSEITKKDCGCDKRKEMLNNPNLPINRIFYKLKYVVLYNLYCIRRFDDFVIMP